MKTFGKSLTVPASVPIRITVIELIERAYYGKVVLLEQMDL